MASLKCRWWEQEVTYETLYIKDRLWWTYNYNHRLIMYLCFHFLVHNERNIYGDYITYILHTSSSGAHIKNSDCIVS